MSIKLINKSKINITYLTLSFILLAPIFIYINNNTISLSTCNTDVSLRCNAIGLSTIFLLPFILYASIKFRDTIFFSLIILVYLIIYSLVDTSVIFQILKSFYPFFLYCALINYIKKKDNYILIDKLINKFFPIMVTIFQIIILLSNPFELEENRPNFLFNFIKIYNYQQYFAFVCFLILGTFIYNSNSFFLKTILLLLLFLTSYHSKNTTVFYILIIFIIIMLTAITLKIENRKKFLYILSNIFFSLFIFIPIFSGLIREFLPDFLNIYQLTTRLDRYGYFFENLDYINLFFGIYPDNFFFIQPHNQLIEYFSLFGIIPSFLLLILLFKDYLIKQDNSKIVLSLVIGFGGGLNELLSHFYATQIIIIYLAFYSYKNNQ